jgi:MFS family permease
VWLADRSPSLKRIVILGGGGSARVALLLLALLPALLDSRQAVYPLIFLAAFRWFAGMASHPAWTALLTKVVPIDIRRLYTSRRMLGMSIVAVAMAPLLGRLIGGVGGIEGFQVAFLLAALLGFASTAAYARIEESPAPAGVARPRGTYRAMLRDGAFRQYLGATVLLHTSVMVAGPFFTVYLVRTLGASPEQVGVLASVDGLSAVVGQAFAGVLAMRHGSRRLLVVAMVIVPALPLIWWAIDSPWQAAIPNALGGAAWAMFNLAAFNLLLEYAPDENVPRYAAAHQTAVLLSSFVGPILGTIVVASWGIRATFVISGVGRIIALIVLLRARHPATETMKPPASGGSSS